MNRLIRLAFAGLALTATAAQAQFAKPGRAPQEPSEMSQYSPVQLTAQARAANAGLRLTGASYQTFPSAQPSDSSRYIYSGNHANNFATSEDNFNGGFSFSAPILRADTMFYYAYASGSYVVSSLYTHQYDAMNRDTNSWNLQSKSNQKYHYNTGGDLVLSEYFDTTGGHAASPTLQAIVVATYNAQHQKTFDSVQYYKNVVRPGTVNLYRYNAAGQLDSLTRFTYSTTTMSYSLYYTQKNTYTPSGKLSTVTNKYNTATQNTYLTYTYDAADRLVTTVTLRNFNNGVWNSKTVDSNAYQGGFPLRSYEARKGYTYSNGGYNPTTNTATGYHLNTAGNWDTVYLYSFNSSKRRYPTYREPILYNASNLITHVISYTYDTLTTLYSATPYDIERYYYEPDGSSTGVSNAATAAANVRVYPNPASGLLTIERPREEDLEVSLYNVQGELVQHRVWTAGRSLQLSVADQPTGVYLLRVSGASGAQTQRVLVQH